MTTEFKPGDVVGLKSGGQVRFVVLGCPPNGGYRCGYWDAATGWLEVILPAVALVKIETYDWVSGETPEKFKDRIKELYKRIEILKGALARILGEPDNGLKVLHAKNALEADDTWKKP